MLDVFIDEPEGGKSTQEGRIPCVEYHELDIQRVLGKFVDLYIRTGR